MVKQGRLPGRGGMAHDAGSGDARLGVRRIVGPVVILRVARVTIGGRGGEVAIDMATGAGDTDVRPG